MSSQAPASALPSGVVEASATTTIPGQTEDVPQTIIATTNVSGVDELISGTWIFKGLYSISPSQLPGTVWATWPCHPSQTNAWNNHVYQMFNAWNGGFKIRARPVSTSAFGGSFRIGKLPPNITADQISNMTLANFSVFPFIEIDPQMPLYVGLSCYDERNTLFHYSGDFNDKDPNSFGGWLVGYIVSPLIQSSDGSSSLNIEVDMTGDFTFAQPNPFFSLVSNDTTVFPNYVSNDILGQGGCDAPMCSTSSAIMLCAPGTEIVMGGVLMGAPGRVDPWSYAQQDFMAATNFRSGVENGTITCLEGSWEDSYHILPKSDTIGTKNLVCRSTNGRSGWPGQTAGGYNKVLVRSGDLDNLPENNYPYVYVRDTADGCFSISVQDETIDAIDTIYYSAGGESEYSTFVDVGQKFIGADSDGDATLFDLMHLTPMVDEAPIFFCDQNMQSASLQPRKMAQYFSNPDFDKLSDTVSIVFLLVDMITGQKYRYIRLSPNGVFTTNYEDEKSMLISSFNPMALQYFTTIPISAPLPKATLEMRSMLKRLTYLNNRLRGKKCSWNRFRKEHTKPLF